MYDGEGMANRMPRDYCTISINTAGYDTSSSPIVEVAAVRVRDCRAVEAMRSFVATYHRVTENLEKNANITEAHIKGAPPLIEVMTELLDFIGDDTIIGTKYARFIKPFVERDALDTCGVVMENNWRDILFLADKMGLLTRDSLTDLCEQLGVPKEHNHRALVDAIAEWRCWELMRLRALGSDEMPAWVMEDVPTRSLGPDTDAEIELADKQTRLKMKFVKWVILAVFFGFCASCYVSYFTEGIAPTAPGTEGYGIALAVFSALAILSVVRAVTFWRRIKSL